MVTPLQNQLRRGVNDDLVYERQFGDLYIYVYTQTAVSKRIWNNTTRMARGLILDKDGNVVARPFDKFFNLFERYETEPGNLPKDKFHIEEKLDGSLGILFNYKDKWDISTKGSLQSDQAKFAREELLKLYDFRDLDPNWTVLTEIIYPDNRIVVDYKDYVGLRLLAIRNRHTGEEVPAGRIPIIADKMGMDCRETYECSNLLESLLSIKSSNCIEEFPFEHNSEGFILKWDSGFRVKIKNPWYLQIHKALDKCNLRHILDMLEGREYRSVFLSLPKELQAQFDDIYSQLRTMLWRVETEMKSAFDSLDNKKNPNRKEFALEVNIKVKPDYRSAMFSLYDGHDIRHHIFKVVRGMI